MSVGRSPKKQSHGGWKGEIPALVFEQCPAHLGSCPALLPLGHPKLHLERAALDAGPPRRAIVG
eukprot:10558134-Alexandrium_andersonii.AAC.1